MRRHIGHIARGHDQTGFCKIKDLEHLGHKIAHYRKIHAAVIRSDLRKAFRLQTLADIAIARGSHRGALRRTQLQLPAGHEERVANGLSVKPARRHPPEQAIAPIDAFRVLVAHA